MEKIEINYIFSIGQRCNSTDFLKAYNMRNISGPFDHLFIDLETTFENIYNKFKLFFSAYVSFKKKYNKLVIKKPTTYLNPIFKNLETYEKIFYMGHNYYNFKLHINQNYIDNMSNNIYDWNRLLISIHHNFTDTGTCNMIRKRVNIFLYNYENNSDKLILFHMTKIMSDNTIDIYKNYIFDLKEKYKINCYLVIIYFSDKLDDGHLYENKVLIIIKKVKSYEIQLETKKIDNNRLKYNKELSIIHKYFDFKLKTYEELVNIINT